MTSSLTPRKRPSCPSCGTLLHRHGGRRFKCPACGVTRRLRRRKPGPKRRRGTSGRRTLRFLHGKTSVRDTARDHAVSYGTAHERIRRGIGSFLQQSSAGLFSWSGQDVTLVPDALWLFCGGERWTVYCVLARHVGDREARIAVCGARRGGESYAGWHAAIEALPFHEPHAATAGDGSLHPRLPLRAMQWLFVCLQIPPEFLIRTQIHER